MNPVTSLLALTPLSISSTFYVHPSSIITTTSTDTMSQAQAPREFKFVGAFSRKRRSRKTPGSAAAPLTAAKRRAIASSTVGVSHQNATALVAASTLVSTSADTRVLHEEQQRSESDAPPGTSTARPRRAPPPEAQQQEPPRATPSSTGEHNAYPVENPIHDMVECPNEGTSQEDDIDWSCSSFMNPFLDPGPSLMDPLSHTNEDYQLPTCFGTEIPTIPSQGTTSTDGSSWSNYFDPIVPNETVDPASIDDVALPPLSSKQAPSNIGVTITQLLDRCRLFVETLLTLFSFLQSIHR